MKYKGPRDLWKDEGYVYAPDEPMMAEIVEKDDFWTCDGCGTRFESENAWCVPCVKIFEQKYGEWRKRDDEKFDKWYVKLKKEHPEKYPSSRSFGIKPENPFSKEEKVLRSVANDPDKSNEIQEHILEKRKTEMASGSAWARRERERKNVAMRNKNEWVKRGRDPQERNEAING